MAKKSYWEIGDKCSGFFLSFADFCASPGKSGCLSEFAQPCKLEIIPSLPAPLKSSFFNGRCHRSTKYFVCLHLRDIGLEKAL